MSKHYSFECYDDEDKSTVRVEFETESDAWSGYEGPAYRFKLFLQGCGFVFDKECQIAIINSNTDDIMFSENDL